MALLSGVLLRDLQFDCLVGMTKSGEERGHRLPDLKVNGPMLDLNHHVAIKRAIQ